MNWVSVLSDLYDKNANLVGKVELVKKAGTEDETNQLILLPISHTTVTAQIEVTINENGDFLKAEEVSQDDKLTIIPVTEKSGGRTSEVAPHPLCDNLKYIAGDYMEKIHIITKDGKKGKDFNLYFKEYIEALGKWCHSKFAHKKVEAIYKYLKKGCLIDDLIKYKVLKPDENGFISEKIKIQKLPQIDALVRFKVECHYDSNEDIINDTRGKYKSEVWLDQTVHQSFIDYYISTQTKRDLCSLTGENTAIAEFHAKKIRSESDSAKLISANDDKYFTFRGRFRNKDEALSIGYEISQKAHNALKWIIRKQGYNRDGLCVVTWESNLEDIVSVFDDISSMVPNSIFDYIEDDTEKKYDTNYINAQKFNMALAGYKQKIDENSNIVIIALDSATTGRLAMTYFKQLKTSKYLENIKKWHNECSWVHTKFIDKKLYQYEGMASLKDIALALYATEQNGMLKLKSNSDGKTPMMISVFNRLFPCIIDGKNIPSDMVKKTVQRASHPESYGRYNWEKILAIACSLVKKHEYENNKEEWKVALNNETKDRDYLYGRLLAIADRVEYSTYDKDTDKDRVTNAKRYMSKFSQRPLSTWQVIRERIQPYLNKQPLGQRIYYSNLLDEISDMFEFNEFSDNSKLNGLYLLGFHSQSFDMKSKKNENNKGEN